MRRGGQSRGLTALLFTDIVGSSDIAVELGDHDWRRLQAEHHRTVRREIKRFGGREIDTAGDGFFVTFDAPAPAVRCAAAVVDAVRALGVNVRAGVHFGETEVARHKVSGIAVTTAARVCSAAKAGQVLVTATVADLAAGSGLEFDGAGLRELKGVPGTWETLVLRTIDGRPLEEPLDPQVAGPLRAEVSQRTARRRRLPLAAGAAALVALVLALVALPLLRSDDAVELGTNSVARFDAQGGGLELQTSLGQRPGASVVGFGSLWVIQSDRAIVVRVDLEDGRVVDSIPVGDAPGGITADETAIWVTDTCPGHREPHRSGHQRDQPDPPDRFGADRPHRRWRFTLGRRLGQCEPPAGRPRLR